VSSPNNSEHRWHAEDNDSGSHFDASRSGFSVRLAGHIGDYNKYERWVRFEDDWLEANV
jgi:hypothetical protein